MADVTSAHSILRRSLLNGLITVDEANDPKFVAAAEDAAISVNDSWPEEEGFGSSDMTFVVEDFLRYAGVKTSYVNGRLTRVPEVVLLPCPFCGSSLIRILPQPYGFSVDCTVCSALKRVHSRSKEQVLAEWNNRSHPEPLKQEEKPLKDLLDRCNEEQDYE